MVLFTRSGFVLEDRDRDCYTFEISTDYVDRILYEYGKGNIGKQSIEDYYIPLIRGHGLYSLKTKVIYR